MRELTRRGDRVDYFCDAAFRDKVTEAGAAHIPYPDALNGFLRAYRPTDRHPFYMLMEYMLSYAEVMLPEALRLLAAKRYDLVIGDSLFGGPVFLRHMTDVPCVSSHSSFAMRGAPVPARMLVSGAHPQLDHCNDLLVRMRAAYRLPELSLTDVFLGRAKWNVVYTLPEFNGTDGLDAQRFLFTGSGAQNADIPPLSAFPTLAGMQDRPTVYVSLGSVNTDFAAFYKACAAAFVTHAGFNSVNEALFFGVPMLALPLVNDQPMVAKRLAELGLGIVGSLRDMTPAALRENVEKLLTDPTLRANCRAMAARFAAFKRLPEVAASLETLAATAPAAREGSGAPC